MRYILAIWVIIVLAGLLIISLINLAENGASGMILAGISTFALYRVFKFVFAGDEADGPEEHRTPQGDRVANPVEYMIYGDLAGEADPAEWEEWEK